MLEIRGSDEADSHALNIDFTTCDRVPGSVCAQDTLQGLQRYLTHPELVVMYNRQRFDESNFNRTHIGTPSKENQDVYEDSVINESVIWNQHINKLQANWMQITFDSTQVEDDVSFINFDPLGTKDEYEYHSVTMGSLGLSYSDDFEGYYKIGGFTLFWNPDQLKIEREAYDFVTWIGDVGGLLDGFLVFGIVLI